MFILPGNSYWSRPPNPTPYLFWSEAVQDLSCTAYKALGQVDSHTWFTLLHN